MYQFFSIRKSKSNPKIGTIYKSVYDNRTPISRESLKITIPIRLWDNKNQQVKRSEEIDFEGINKIINEHKTNFSEANQKYEPPNNECFIEFALNHLRIKYTNEETKLKYTTIIKSLQLYAKEALRVQSLSIEKLRQAEFIVGYKNWLYTRQYKKRDNSIRKKTNTVYNYVSVIKTLVKKYNEDHPERDEIKTAHFLSGLDDGEEIPPRMLYPDQIDRLINYNPVNTKRRDKTLDAKHHFLFQMLTNGIRVSDLLLLNFKHFKNGRIEIRTKKTGKSISIPFVYKAAKILGYFYPEEYRAAIDENLLGDLDLNPNEVEELIKINSLRKPLADLTIEDLHLFRQFLSEDKTNDNALRLDMLKGILNRMERHVAYSMCRIMGHKPSGFVFDYLSYDDFKNLTIMDKKKLSPEQSYLLHRARTRYNGRLETIGKRIDIEKLTSHVSRHSFAYYMLSTGAKIEEISFALAHSNYEVTQAYLKQFPSQYSDKAIERCGDSFNI